jgi:hypothetical protein
MTVYTQSQSGDFIAPTFGVPADPAHPLHIIMLQEVLDLTSTIILYAASVQELPDKIAAKQDEIAVYFRQLEGMTLTDATAMDNVFALGVTPAAVRFGDNVTKGNAAIGFVGALGDVIAVDIYDSVVDPNWSI